jgi:signal transduction histidine kinase
VVTFDEDSLPLPTFAVDARGTFAPGNRAWRELAGEIGLIDALAPERRDGLRATVAAGLRGGMPFVLAAELRRADGVYVPHQLHARPSSGGWVVTAVESNRAPVPRAASTPSAPDGLDGHDDESVVTPSPDVVEDFRRQMLGLVGHDLRNPLNTVVMASSLIKSRAKTEAEVKLVERVIHASDRLTRMITELLDFTACRLGGKVELVRDPASLGTLVGETVSELAAARKTTVALDLAETREHAWDATRIEQVVSNLVLNAILHGKPPVRVSLRETENASFLEIHDAGGELDVTQRDHLFAPTRKRLSTTREAGSLGLGLYVTEQIVQAFGGRIDVRSRPGEGTTFTVELPHVEPSAES